MNTTLAIYGPWERISTDFHLYKAFTQYLQQARDIKQISKIIYVQTEAEHTIPTQYVDDVYFTDRTNIFDECTQNNSKLNFDYNLGFLGANIHAAHKNSKTSHIICHRCDVIPRNLLNLIQIYETLGKESGVKIEGYGNNCKVKGKSGVNHQIDVLIVACNTATTNAIKILRENYKICL